MAYKLIKLVISRGNYDRDDITDKLAAYLAFGQITVEQYSELMDMIEKEDKE